MMCAHKRLRVCLRSYAGAYACAVKKEKVVHESDRQTDGLKEHRELRVKTLTLINLAKPYYIYDNSMEFNHTISAGV